LEKNIIQQLQDIEKKFDVKILYACESGSRAWGFASPDSDYDVRFIYVHQKDYYLNIDGQRDVIELPINDLLDINGWELRKALRLFRKSNGPLYEWLQSPIVYKKDDNFHDELMALMPTYFSKRSTMHHYLSMAKTVFEPDLAGEDVRLKKYFYALRPILACRWIADKKEVPPMEFNKLRILAGDSINIRINDLLKQKSQVDERFIMKAIPEFNSFIKEQITYCEKAVPEITSIADSDLLNQFFRKYAV